MTTKNVSVSPIVDFDQVADTQRLMAMKLPSGVRSVHPMLRFNQEEGDDAARFVSTDELATVFEAHIETARIKVEIAALKQGVRERQRVAFREARELARVPARV